ncbi:hypothetical protein NCAS_0H00420 [Naumovozyma castellii]|uniref:Yippee domain-containing protein n=1 Tax=Naumovozyma castellii TaxID=27288 RepID=G0VIM7_NAUCA|nr:hypothetical protein NCAS_0H00420 [Naumovozyma castellii CBS 4309]CCC71352.1 hypothetical protein NCAS_0H00420 [Naumovozyma castellii CBS 4309]
MGLRYTSYIEPPRTYRKYLKYDSVGSTPYSSSMNVGLDTTNSRSLTPVVRYSDGAFNLVRFPPSSSSSSSHRRARLRRKKSFITYGCKNCRTHISSSNRILSKDYRGVTGDAYLMDEVVNIVEGPMQERPMVTGHYLVADIYCHWCRNLIGWKYLKSERKEQAYKEGKFIIEVATVCVCD